MIETIENWAYGALGKSIWEKKYRQGDESFSEWLDRVSFGIPEMRKLIAEKRFIPGGRILSNLNDKTTRKITYSNCYVITAPEDNLKSIFECSRKLAQTYSRGGGCGIDLSNLRPNGAAVNNASKTSSGPVSFMGIYSQVTGTIAQNGRRGALMISLDVRHPDVEEFIDSKANTDKINYANISVRVNDAFMKAVELDSDYLLRWPCENGVVYGQDELEYNKLYFIHNMYVRRVKARELFNKLVHNNWAFAEPGILYWDRISSYNMVNTDSTFKYGGVNPCAEEPLPNGGSCLLGSLNLSEFVHAGTIDFPALEEAVNTSVIYLNKVLDAGLPLHALDEQKVTVRDWRQIGLGTMGLADMLIKVRDTYGSPESINLIEEVYKRIARAAVLSSLALAKTDGAYPQFKPEVAESSFIKALDFSEKTIKEIKKFGLRNSQLLTCAPTGSTATMIGVSTGVEPIFAMSYTRTTKSLEGKDKDYKVLTPIAEQWKAANPGKELPKYFVDSSQINPSVRIEVQAALQKYTDASISSTINLPQETTEDTVYNIYMQAWQKGLKGVTVFRAGCERQAILTTEKKEQLEEKGFIFDYILPPTRDDFGEVLSGFTFKKKTACGSLYITINTDKKGNIVEIFTNTSKQGTCQANLNGETRMTSLALRAGVKVDEVIDQLKGIRCASCLRARGKGEHIDGISCPDILGSCLQEVVQLLEAGISSFRTDAEPTLLECPECHKKTLRADGGCLVCPNCGYSRCN